MGTALLEGDLQQKITEATQIIDNYKWLIDSYIVDFYERNHWNNMPVSWINCFTNLPTQAFAELLSFDPKGKEMVVWPLAIIALRSLFRRLGQSRSKDATSETTTHEMLVNTVFQQRKVLFQKSVKLKKRHEIEQFAISCSIEPTNNCKAIIDIGSGQGNLARTLAYGFGFHVCCIEQNISFIKSARQKDSDLWQKLIKRNPTMPNIIKHPIHLHKKVNLDQIDSVGFVKMIKDVMNDGKNQPDVDEFTFGLVGLHPCGDLAPSLLRLFLACQECRFIKLVCCCYMKLSTTSTPFSSASLEYGFPMSEYCRNAHLTLSYEAREIACHAIEQYREKLLTDYSELKVHAYRATIETIIVRLRPDLKHSGLKGGIKANQTTFEEYCQRACEDLSIHIDNEALHSESICLFLGRWEQVVKFYTLRLMFAPLVETIILYDRLLFLLENGARVRLDALFDPHVSPRNHAITAFK